MNFARLAVIQTDTLKYSKKFKPFQGHSVSAVVKYCTKIARVIDNLAVQFNLSSSAHPDALLCGTWLYTFDILCNKKKDCDPSSTTCEDNTGDMGGYQCRCKPGYNRSSKFACAPPRCNFGYMFSPSHGGCADINECASSNLNSKFWEKIWETRWSATFLDETLEKHCTLLFAIP